MPKRPQPSGTQDGKKKREEEDRDKDREDQVRCGSMAAMRPFPETHTLVQTQTRTPTPLPQPPAQAQAAPMAPSDPQTQTLYIQIYPLPQNQMLPTVRVPSTQPLSGHYRSAGKKDKKRELNSANERRYRKSMHSKFDELRQLLNMDAKEPKPAVLQKAIDYIRSLQQMNHRQQPEETTGADSKFDEEWRKLIEKSGEHFDGNTDELQSTPDNAQQPASSSEDGTHTLPAAASIQEPATNHQSTPSPGLSSQLSPRPDGVDLAHHRETEGADSKFDEEWRKLTEEFSEHFDGNYNITTCHSDIEFMMELQSNPDIAQQPASSSEEGPHTSPAAASIQEPATK